VAAFAQEYETWKRISGVADFSDVIHDAWESCDTAPGNPSIIFVDEAQDHDRAELRLVRKWAEAPGVEKLVIVGDPDQNLYQWRGSEPEAFYESEIPPENRRVLAQSYRVPVAVHQVAMEMISRIRDRQPVEYLPRDDAGEVQQLDAHFGARLVDEVVAHAMPHIAARRSVMFLASCEYQLKPLCTELRQRGIPYWNPLAKDRGSMNPLHPSNGQSACDRLLSFLRPLTEVHGDQARVWTPRDLWAWLEVCECRGWLSKGAKTTVEKLAKADKQSPLEPEQLEEWMNGTVPEQLADLDPSFLRSRLLSAKRSTMTFALDVLRHAGYESLRRPPSVIVGTIHSVKGGESDVVYLSPDLSPQGFDQYESAQRAQVIRQFYVGITRARNTLVLCSASSPRAIDW
jgi:superfamily I DNA/RNA helicase